MEIRIDDSYLSAKAKEVRAAFKAIKQHAQKEVFYNFPYFNKIGVEHIQGYIQCEFGGKRMCIFTHKVDGGPGRIILTDGPGGKVTVIKSGCYSHPGGMQAIGKYLFVPCEKEDTSKILIYDLEKIDTGMETPEHCVTFHNHRATCLGITDFTKNGVPHYLLIVGVGEQYYAYIAEVPANIKFLKFSAVGEFTLDKEPSGHYDVIRCRSFGLVTDTENQVYMVAMATHGCGVKNEDYAYLIEIDPSDVKSYRYAEYHRLMNDSVQGYYRTHFVWGAGVRINPDGQLMLLATSRNIIGSSSCYNTLETNYWAN